MRCNFILQPQGVWEGTDIFVIFCFYKHVLKSCHENGAILQSYLHMNDDLLCDLIKRHKNHIMLRFYTVMHIDKVIPKNSYLY